MFEMVMSMNSKGIINKILSMVFVLSISISVFFMDTASAANVTKESVSATSNVSKTSSSKAKKTSAKSTTKSYSNKYKVTATKTINIYKGAGTKYGVVSKISKGTTLYITKNSSGNWVSVKTSKAAAGYVQTKYINKTSGSSISMTCKTKDNVNLRKGAGTNYSVLTVVPKGKTVSVVTNSNPSWTKAKYGSKTGYLSNTYVTLIFKIPATHTTPPKSTPSTPDTAAKPSNGGTFTLKYRTPSMYKGCYYQNAVVSNTTGETIKWYSSNSSIATVDSYGIIYGKKTGSVTITAKTTHKTIRFTLKVKKPSRSVNISNKSYTANRDKTIYLGSSTSGAKWTSLDTNYATVSGGLVKCKKAGKVVILAKVSGGWASCVVTVKGREAVRFTYSNPNSAPKNSKVTFIAITDKIRTGVKFVISKGKTSYTVKATSKQASGDTYIWKGSKKLTSPGSYKVIAYSKYGNKWSKSTGSYGKAFVTSVGNKSTTSCEQRHASNEIISFISNYEGFLSKAIFDPLTNFPCLTVGYGRVIYVGESFYNNMTKSEAMAYLVESVETDGYVSKVNSFLLDNKIKFNQQQFDSLVSFVYNCGPGVLTSDSDIRSVLFNTHPSSQANPTKGKTSTKCNMRKKASGTAAVVKVVPSGTSVTLLSGKAYSGSYYYVKDSSGKKGYIPYKALNVTSFNSKGTRDLCNTNKKNYINNFFCYHHAGGVCYYGLLYRRIDECEIFFHGDYARDGEKNKCNFNFRCTSHNPSFGC